MRVRRLQSLGRLIRGPDVRNGRTDRPSWLGVGETSRAPRRCQVWSRCMSHRTVSHGWARGDREQNLGSGASSSHVCSWDTQPETKSQRGRGLSLNRCTHSLAHSYTCKHTCACMCWYEHRNYIDTSTIIYKYMRCLTCRYMCAYI